MSCFCAILAPMRTLIFVSLLVIISCSQSKKENTTYQTSGVEYSTTFSITEEQLIVFEPWPGATKPYTFDLSNPPSRFICTSTTHLPYLELLGVTDRLVGFPGTKYINSKTIRDQVAAGITTDLGPDGNMNLELLISLKPDLVMVFDMGTESTVIDKIIELGIPVIYNADFLEKDALGRAEWIKFFGALFDRRGKADSVFSRISTTYDSIRSLVTAIPRKPSVFSGIMYGDGWFMPGGRNWSSGFLKDAGAEYLWANDTSSGWLEVSFESVLDRAKDADYWVGLSTVTSLEELTDLDSRYTDFKAFQSGQVFNYSKRRNEFGGFDYFEMGYARPDLVLADLVNVFHPNLLPDHETVFFEPLQ